MIKVFKKSKDNKHKYSATFKKTSKTNTIQFGANGYKDFTILSRDKTLSKKQIENKKQSYNRHKKREHWNDLETRGSLSKNIMWNKPTVEASIKDINRRFRNYNLKLLK